MRAAEPPGIQYLVVDSATTRCDRHQGWADLACRRPMAGATTMMAYSMSKTITATAVLQLVQAGKLALDDAVQRYCEFQPYGREVTVRQLLSHTSGIPNPLPLRWVHPISGHAAFDEGAALRSVLLQHPRLASPPGARYRYSNIGYWLLGAVVEAVSGETFTSFVTKRILQALGAGAESLSYAVADPLLHATGYLEKFSLMNLAKPLLIDRSLVGNYAGSWLEIRGHYVNGPAFGGLVGNARGFGVFLQDQLRTRSLLLGDTARGLLCGQQHLANGIPIPMTLGWHIGSLQGITFLYKEGGGGGFHSMMRLYPSAGIGTVVMTNATQFAVGEYLDRNDCRFLEAH